MSPLEITAICAACVAAGYGGVRWLFAKDEKREDRRRAAAKLAAILSQLGLKRLPEILICYSVGDYSGMFREIAEFVKLFLAGEAVVIEEFHSVFENVLTARLKTEEGRAYIAAKLADATQETDPDVVKRAPKAKAA